jgi:copper(I)-binding protein
MRDTDERRKFMLTALAALGAASFTQQARACEYITSHLRITHPWTRATAHGADAAVLCMRIDEVSQADRLIGVQTPIASGAVLSTGHADAPLDLAIPQGSELDLTEAGLHVRLTGLKAPLQVGRTYPLDLYFAESGVVLAQLTVDFTAMRFR